MIVGAHPWARDIAGVLKQEGYKVLLVDLNRNNARAARLAGLPAHCASILSEYIVDELDLGGLGRLLAMTPNDEVNALATLHFTEVFGRANVFQLAPKEIEHTRRQTVSQPLRGRLLFCAELTYADLNRRFRNGAVIKKTRLTPQFNYTAFQELYGQQAIILFVIDQVGNLTVVSTEEPPAPLPGQTVISLVDPVDEDAIIDI
jgi:hypothetical protein